MTPAQPQMKLAVIHIKDLDVYNAVYDKSSSVTFYVDGKSLPLSYTNKSVLLDKESLDKVVVKNTTTRIVAWKNKLTGEQLSPKEYTLKCEALLEQFDADGDEWANIDAEYAWKKWSQGWEAVREYDEHVVKPLIEIVEVTIDTGSKNISPIWSIETLPDEKRLFSLDIYAATKEAFIAACNKWEATYEIPSHSGLRYAKVDGEYVFQEEWKGAFHGTLAKAKAREKEVKEDVEKSVAVVVSKKRGLLLTNLELAEVHKQLVGIQNTVRGLSVKQGGSEDRQSVVSRLSKLIASVASSAKEKLDKQVGM